MLQHFHMLSYQTFCEGDIDRGRGCDAGFTHMITDSHLKYWGQTSCFCCSYAIKGNTTMGSYTSHNFMRMAKVHDNSRETSHILMILAAFKRRIYFAFPKDSDASACQLCWQRHFYNFLPVVGREPSSGRRPSLIDLSVSHASNYHLYWSREYRHLKNLSGKVTAEEFLLITYLRHLFDNIIAHTEPLHKGADSNEGSRCLQLQVPRYLSEWLMLLRVLHHTFHVVICQVILRIHQFKKSL